MWLLLSDRFASTHGERELAAAGLFLLASITDGIDGWLARRRGQITSMGMLFDPLADKRMVTAAYVTLVQFIPRIFPAWGVVMIIRRAFLASGPPSSATHD